MLYKRNREENIQDGVELDTEIEKVWSEVTEEAEGLNDPVNNNAELMKAAQSPINQA